MEFFLEKYKPSKETIILYQRSDKTIAVYAEPATSPQLDFLTSAAAKKQIEENYVTIKFFESIQSKFAFDNEIRAGRKNISPLFLVSPQDEENQFILASFWNEKSSRGFIVMRYLRAVPLQKIFFSKEFVAPRGFLPRVFVVSIVAQLCFVLKEYQGRKFIHRDLKLPNIMFDPKTGKVFVIDFGSSKFIDDDDVDDGVESEESNTVVVGTRHLRPPEYASTAISSSSSRSPFAFDIYGLGCALVELLTGSPCFGSFDFSASGKTKEEFDAAVESLILNPIRENMLNFTNRQKNAAIEKEKKESKKKILLERLRTKNEQEEMACDLIKKLLEFDAEKRIANFDGILSHPFLQSAVATFFKEGFEDFGEEDESQNLKKNPLLGSDITTWFEFSRNVVLCFENVEDELEMQLLGL